MRSPWSVEFINGYSRSASMTLRATNGRYDSLPRVASTPDMSASTIVVQCAAVSSEWRMCSPIFLRMIDSGSPPPPGRRLRGRDRLRGRRGILPVRRLHVQHGLRALLVLPFLDECENVLLGDASAH